MEKKLKCFISYSIKTNISFLKNILIKNNVSINTCNDLKVGESIQENIKKSIKRSDFIIAVLSENNSNIFYEMGICEGIGKPLFIIVDKNFNLPAYLENNLHIKCSLKDKNLLNITIKEILDNFEEIKRNRVRKKEYKITKSYLTNSQIDNYLNIIRENRNNMSGFEFEKLVSKIFSNFKINFQSNTNDKGVDFAFWNKNLNNSIGNPILVELKIGSFNKNKIDKAKLQLENFIFKSEAKAGILLYLDKSGKHFSYLNSLNPLILCFEIEKFLTLLRNNSFEEIIIDQRNQLAHGITE